jgi:hypothetical protein
MSRYHRFLVESALRVLVEGAVFLFVLAVIFVALYVTAP